MFEYNEKDIVLHNYEIVNTVDNESTQNMGSIIEEHDQVTLDMETPGA